MNKWMDGSMDGWIDIITVVCEMFLYHAYQSRGPIGGSMGGESWRTLRDIARGVERDKQTARAQLRAAEGRGLK